MTVQEIRRRIAEGADARFGETIEKVMFTLLNRHTHQCWRGDCDCEYCNFITGDYINAKMHLHKLKKRLRKYERCGLTFDDACGMMSIETLVDYQQEYVRRLKRHKQSLKTNIV